MAETIRCFECNMVMKKSKEDPTEHECPRCAAHGIKIGTWTVRGTSTETKSQKALGEAQLEFDVPTSAREPEEKDESPSSDDDDDDVEWLIEREATLENVLARMNAELIGVRKQLKRRMIETHTAFAENDDDCTCLLCGINYGCSSHAHTCAPLFPDK